MNQKPTVNYPSQFAFLLGLMGVFMVLTAFLVPFIGSLLMHVPFLEVLKQLNRPENANISRFLNTMASFLIFLLPPLILARVMSKTPFTQLGFQSAISSKQLVLIMVLTVTSIIFSGALGQLNEWIPLPAALHAKAKALEDAYKESMMSMANMKNTTDYLLSILVLAAAPALFEEVLFRGGFQQVFIGWTKSKWAGIIITSIVFSLVHFSYFGFLPRLALGLVLGLIFYYSKNIWLNIFLHFLNNALVVTQLYISGKQGKPIEKTMDENLPVWWGIGALVLLVIMLKAFKKESVRVLAEKEHNLHSSPENIVS
ncbi:MAG: CPBP family intramembrane glutamic endopeptidase [Bacteroidota bacterium]